MNSTVNVPVRRNFTDYIFQGYCVVAVSFISLTLGTAIGWSAVIPKLQTDPDLPYNITTDDVRWLNANFYITALAGSLMSGFIVGKFGFRKIVGTTFAFYIVFWIVLGYQRNKILLHFLRTCSGIQNGIVSTIMFMYVSELCEPRIRGLLSCLPELILSFGILLSYIMAKFLPWKEATLLLAIVPIIGLFSFTVVPESPYWLMRMGRKSAAKDALLRLMGSHRADDVTNLLNDIEENLDTGGNKYSIREQIKLLPQPQNWKPILLIISFFILRELCGQAVIFNYTVYLFEATGVPLDEFSCTILVGLIRLIFGFIGAVIIDRIGRRPLFNFSVFVYFLAMAACFGGLWLAPNTPLQNWMSLIGVLVAVSSYGIGLGPIPWILTGELLPLPVKPVAATCTISLFEISSFSMLAFFPTLITFGMDKCFLLFTISSLLILLVGIKFLPETKNKSLLELENAFLHKKKTKNIQKCK